MSSARNHLSAARRLNRLRIELAATENVETIGNIARAARRLPGSDAVALAERADAKAARCTPNAPRRKPFVVEKSIKIAY
jgi:hypothetical protein